MVSLLTQLYSGFPLRAIWVVNPSGHGCICKCFCAGGVDLRGGQHLWRASESGRQLQRLGAEAFCLFNRVFGTSLSGLANGKPLATNPDYPEGSSFFDWFWPKAPHPHNPCGLCVFHTVSAALLKHHESPC